MSSSTTTYSIEHAKSGRSSCKKCKIKIAKDELRLGRTVPGPEFDMQSWFHPECFPFPRNLKKEGVTVESFVTDILQDNTDETILQSNPQEIIDKLASKVKSTAKKKEVEEEGKIEKIKANLALVRAEIDEDGPPKKKAKKSFTEQEEGEMEVYGLYEKHTADQLKDILRWNSQLRNGTKAMLVLRVIDGHTHGRLGRCVVCGNGRLGIREAAGEDAACTGYYDEDIGRRVSCHYKCKLAEAPRILPWFTREPTEEELEEMKREAGEGADDAEKGDKKKLLDLASKLEWNLDSKDGIKKATADLIQVCMAEDGPKVDIPADSAKGKMAVGKLVAGNRSSTATEVLDMVIQKYGYVSKNEEKSKKRSEAAEGACANPANGPIFVAINELRELYFKEGNSQAGATYTNAANAIVGLDFEITEENAKKLGKPGKVKVEGIGKGTAEKIHEFITTGKIQKLEDKRAAAAD